MTHTLHSALEAIVGLPRFAGWRVGGMLDLVCSAVRYDDVWNIKIETEDEVETYIVQPTGKVTRLFDV